MTKRWLVAAAVLIVGLILYWPYDEPEYPPPPEPQETVACVDDGYGGGMAEVEPGVWVDCMYDQDPDNGPAGY
jgi:hypothetical protein